MIDALFVVADGFFTSRRVQFAVIAVRHAIPAIYFSREFPEAGGLMSYGTDAASRRITVMPRHTPPGNVVCWTPCGQPGAIVLGADPDPFIRSQLLRDASRYFGGGGR
jgi:hypothetical protein